MRPITKKFTSFARPILFSTKFLPLSGYSLGVKRLYSALITRPLYYNKPPFGETPKTPERSLFISVEATPNPDSLKFVPGVEVVEAGGHHFENLAAARVSPLAKRIFQVKGVTDVFLAPTYISVNKEPSELWEPLQPQIFSAITHHFASGDPPIDFNYKPNKDTEVLPTDSEEVAMIKELLDTRVRPSVQQDGGDIEYLGFEDGIVFVKMRGSCAGCPSSTTTVKSGIEKMLQYWVPEVLGVVAVESDDELAKINMQHLAKVTRELEAKDSKADE